MTGWFFSVASPPEHFKAQVLEWFSRFSTCMFLDSCGFADPYGKYEWIAAAGVRKAHTAHQYPGDLPVKGWLFGHLGYEAYSKYRNGSCSSGQYPKTGFFAPEIVVCKRRGEDQIRIYTETEPKANTCLQSILQTRVPPPEKLPVLQFQKAFEKEAYCQVITQLRHHIQMGDCYEINFCNARTARAAQAVNGAEVYRRLHALSPAPFSVCYRTPDFWMAGASPERYLALSENTLVSQPIKGTAPRHAEPEMDRQLAETLRHSPKEQAENVMITDLTRSDFARVCRPGSVAVAALFEVQHFPQVHQLVSSVTGTLLSEKTIWDALYESFPMGSMTGAPRQKVMELIAQYEVQPRGLFSGSVGFIDPDGHADFNVVIRTVFGWGRAVQFNTGGAITWSSDPEQEWEECLLKGRAIESIFAG